MTRRFVMAIDAGTGSGRAIIYDLSGTQIGLAQEEWSHTPVPGVPGALNFDTAANGALIDRVIGQAIAGAGIDPGDIGAVAATSMREGVVLYDAHDREIWACPNVDGRAQDEAAILSETGIADEIYGIGGDWVSITAPARILWLKRHQPEVFARVRKLGMISDWMATRLTGRHVTEPSAGSSSALFDLGRRQWSERLLSLVDLDPAMMPEVVESGSQIGTVTPTAAARCGLAAGTPVIAGGGDTQLALLGLGRRAGQATLVGGSFWQMTILSDHALIDPAFGPRTLCHARPGEWMVEGIGFLSGFALRWFRDAFVEPVLRHGQANIDSFALIEEMAAQAPAGAGGLVALAANRMQSDNWRQPPLGFLGFDINNPGGALGNGARAVMEAGAFLAHTHLRALETLSGQTYETIQFTGGSSQSAVWSQLIADILGRPVDIPVMKETTALGCAMLAAAGAGMTATLDEAIARMASPIDRRVDPDADRTAAYHGFEARWASVTNTASDIAEAGVLEPLWRPAGARSALGSTRKG